MQFCRFVILGLLFAAISTAGDIESLHIANFNFDFRPGLTLQLHTRTRTFENVGAYGQFRGGPILLLQVRPRWTALAGYYLIDQSTRETHARYRVQRFWTGVQPRLLSTPNWTVDGRSVIERFVSDEFEDYYRLRNRVMVNRKVSIGQLYASAELLRQTSINYGRYTAGLQWKPHKRVTMGTGYEYRDAPRGPGSHIIATFFQFDGYRHTPSHID